MPSAQYKLCSPNGYAHMHPHRYERKKNIELAISALQQFKSLRVGVKGLAEKKGLLVVAGGYDLRVEENVQYLEASFCTVFMLIVCAVELVMCR